MLFLFYATLSFLVVTPYLMLRNKWTYDYCLYLNRLLFLNNILRLIEKKPAYSNIILPNYSHMLFSIKPVSHHFLKPADFKMYYDITPDDELSLYADSPPEIKKFVHESVIYVKLYEQKRLGKRLHLKGET